MIVRFAIRLRGWFIAAGRLQFHIMRIPKAELSQLELRIIVLLCNIMRTVSGTSKGEWIQGK